MQGFDISHNNGRIDFQGVIHDPSNPGFVFIKATQGKSFQDPMFYHNASGAKQAGLQVGYYHFASLNDQDVEGDAKAEAAWFVSVVKNAAAPDLPLVLDIEDEKGAHSLTKDQVFLWIKTFLYTLAQAGYPSQMIYSYSYFLDAHLPEDHNLGSTPLWIACYRPVMALPKGWDSAVIWQYSQTGRIQGISTYVDLNKFV